jgi:hypothetical protein
MLVVGMTTRGDALMDVLGGERSWATLGGGIAVAVLVGLVLLVRAYILPPRLGLKGKVVIITGGSSGIGKAIAKVRVCGVREEGRCGYGPYTHARGIDSLPSLQEVLGHGAHAILVARATDKLEGAWACSSACLHPNDGPSTTLSYFNHDPSHTQPPSRNSHT